MKTFQKLISFMLLFIALSCDKEETKPTTNSNNGNNNSGTVAKAPAFDASVASTTEGITDLSFKIGSTLKDNGGSAITQHGHVWSDTKTEPTIADSKTELGASSGPFPLKFNSEIKGLKPNTTYNVRAYATNDKGTTYGVAMVVKTGALPVTSSGNFLFYGTEKGIVAIDALTEKVAWTNNTLQYANKAPFLYQDKVIIGANNNVFGLDLKTGVTKWEFKTGGGGGVYITLEKGVVYASTDGNFMIYAIDASTGTQKWSFKAGGGIQQQPAVNDNLVFASSNGDGKIFALDKKTGSLKWSRKGGGSIATRNLNATNDFLIGSAASRDSNFVCFEAATGKVKWNGGRVGYYDVPTIINNIIYLAIEFDFSAYDIASGKLLWKLATPNSLFYPSSSFTVSNGFAYAIDGNGLLYGMDVTNGSKKWTYPKVDRDSSPTLVSNLLYSVGEKTGSDLAKVPKEIVVLDAKTGELKSKISVSDNPPTTFISAFINGKSYYPGGLSVYQ